MVGRELARVRFVEPCSWFFDLEGGGGVSTESLWRIIAEKMVRATSEDHGQQFGLPAPVDSAARARELLRGAITAASVRPDSGDLVLEFGDGSRVEFLTTSAGYENWQIFSGSGDAGIVSVGGGRASPVVALKDIVDGLDMVSDECQAFLNVNTGEVVLRMEFGTEEPDVESGEFLPLPDQFDIEDHRILDSFCEQVEDRRARSELLSAIRGRGAFKRFKALAGRFGLLDAWYKHREEALKSIAVEWCNDHGIGYTIRGGG
jgi:Uncharacterised protein family (UPF0158)